MNDRHSARRLHESTKHGTPPASPESLVSYQRLDPRNAPRPFKEYRGLVDIALPRELVRSEIPAAAVLSGEAGESRPLDQQMVASLLYLSAGVTRMAGPRDRRVYFRAAMSAGNLHPVEVYVVVGDGGVEGIESGVYHFSPLEITLTPLREGDYRVVLGIDSPLTVVLTGIPWRTTWKYGERGWRHLYWDSGTMLANMLAVADSHGLDHRTVLGFDDRKICDLIGIDGVEEMPLAMVSIGSAGDVEPSAVPGLEPPSADVAPVAPSPIRLPLLQEAQAGSTLASGEVQAWRQAGPGVARECSSRVTAPPDPTVTIEEVILRRGSTREMVHGTVPRSHLDWPMASSIRPVGFDVIPDGTLLEHNVNIHAVDGLHPGAYRHAGAGIELLRSVDLVRDESAALCLGQPLGGDSAYTVFHCADLDAVLGRLGSRGYRVTQLESGVVSGRLALCAFTMGLGATGLTFFDDLVSAYFDTSAQPMLVTSVGVPSKPPAPAGTPGSPAVLER